MGLISDGVEQIIASEARRFAGKDPTKRKLVAGLYALSAVSPELGKVARASYFFIRHLDDLLDGEMTGVANPLEYTEHLREQIIQGRPGTTRSIGRLASYALPVLEKRGHPTDNPRADFVQVIDAMVFDYHRRQTRQALSGAELTDYYHHVLDPGANLMLMGFRSVIRVNDLPSFSPNLGRLYSVRDIRKDWELGFINIPTEVLIDGQLDPDMPFDILVRNQFAQDWFAAEIHEAGMQLQTIKPSLPPTEHVTHLALSGLISQAVAVQPPQ